MSILSLFSADVIDGGVSSFRSQSSVSMIYDATPRQQEMIHADAGAPLFPSGAEDNRGLYKVCYICSECLERNRDCFPLCVCTAYGRLSASGCCNAAPDQERELEELVRHMPVQEMWVGIGDGPPQGSFCTYRSCGNPYDYHCTGEIVKNHCYICSVGCTAVAVFVVCGIEIY
ncbi:MAG: hypothetical protein QG632_410 [Candidatus Dependentiae bacterium]|nr:hypothetical protein [Candidatus Dependentiae bacterium]